MRKFISLILLACAFMVTQNVVADNSTFHKFEIVKDVGASTIEATQVNHVALEATYESSVMVYRQESSGVAYGSVTVPANVASDRMCYRQFNKSLVKPRTTTPFSENSVRAWS